MNDLPTILIIAAIMAGVSLIAFLAFGLSPLLRWYVKSTGERARAVILEKRLGRWATYTGGEYNHQMTAQQVTLKLEVHPKDGPAYVVEERFMAKMLDLMRLTPGCEVDVVVARGNPKWVVSLPETATASANASVEARANLAMADVAEAAARGGGTGAEDVMRAMRARGVRTGSAPSQDSPQAKLEQLKGMLNSGLITQKEFEAKKTEILSRM